MSSVTTLPRGRPYTRVDLDAMPDDGHRYELVDGSLVVTPSPSRRHQLVSSRLFAALHKMCPADFLVLHAPLDVVLAEHTVMQPDLLVVRRQDFDDLGLPLQPLLVIEILSASTKQVDLTLKRAVYEAAGCASYWVVDPDLPALTIWELQAGAYVDTGHAEGEQQLTVARPYDVTITPAQLVR